MTAKTKIYAWMLKRFTLLPYGKGPSIGTGFRHEISRDGDLYMRRYILWKSPLGSVYLHEFFRGDADKCCHDHPWGFVSIVLWGGYYEEVPLSPLNSDLALVSRVTRYRPGSVLIRQATWQHRVLIPDGKKAWSLVLTGPRCREWGFWTLGTTADGQGLQRVWVHWERFVNGVFRCE